jgi:hypothetical protein
VVRLGGLTHIGRLDGDVTRGIGASPGRLGHMETYTAMKEPPRQRTPGLASASAMNHRPSNKQMQRTRRGEDGASPLICVFYGRERMAAHGVTS